ncbi:MAG TPA: hypothetical protein VL326_26735 [Kofleriaceae bacterium]|nr:hypothetical protein [Kofleriaceae bacterium]
MKPDLHAGVDERSEIRERQAVRSNSMALQTMVPDCDSQPVPLRIEVVDVVARSDNRVLVDRRTVPVAVVAIAAVEPEKDDVLIAKDVSLPITSRLIEIKWPVVVV